LKQAQLSKDEVRTSTLRLLLSEIHNSEIAKGSPLEEPEILAVVQREIKKRKEAAAGFRQGGREEGAQKEDQEAEILSAYLPPQISDEELTKLVEESINEVGAKTPSEMGKVIGLVINKAKGMVDGARVSALVREKLNV
jgi:hypothetical protein